MTDDENRQVDNEIIDQDRQAELPALADAVFADLDLKRQDVDPAFPWNDEEPDERIMDETPVPNAPVLAAPEIAECLALGWPPFLAKAAVDEFWYAAGLRTGLIVTFTEAARIEGCPDWVHLKGVIHYSLPFAKPVNLNTPSSFFIAEGMYTFERGLQVRLADIMWVADAPYGS